MTIGLSSKIENSKPNCYIIRRKAQPKQIGGLAVFGNFWTVCLLVWLLLKSVEFGSVLQSVWRLLGCRPSCSCLSSGSRSVTTGATAAAGAGTGQSSCSGWPGRSSCREELVTSASEGSCEGEGQCEGLCEGGLGGQGGGRGSTSER